MLIWSFGVLTPQHRAGRKGRAWRLAHRRCQLESLVIPARRPFGGQQQSVLVLIHMLWGVGLLYGIFVTLFAHRFFDIAPEDMTPLLWVVMARPRSAPTRISADPDGSASLPRLDAAFVDVALIMWAWAEHGGFRCCYCSAPVHGVANADRSPGRYCGVRVSAGHVCAGEPEAVPAPISRCARFQARWSIALAA